MPNWSVLARTAFYDAKRIFKMHVGNFGRWGQCPYNNMINKMRDAHLMGGHAIDHTEMVVNIFLFCVMEK